LLRFSGRSGVTEDGEYGSGSPCIVGLCGWGWEASEDAGSAWFPLLLIPGDMLYSGMLGSGSTLLLAGSWADAVAGALGDGWDDWP